MTRGAYMVQWIETERGWGQRNDGVFYYLTEDQAEKDTEEIVKKMREYEAKIFGRVTPEEYSFPQPPVFVEVDENLYKEIKKSGRVSKDRHEKLKKSIA